MRPIKNSYTQNCERKCFSLYCSFRITKTFLRVYLYSIYDRIQCKIFSRFRYTIRSKFIRSTRVAYEKFKYFYPVLATFRLAVDLPRGEYLIVLMDRISDEVLINSGKPAHMVWSIGGVVMTWRFENQRVIWDMWNHEDKWSNYAILHPKVLEKRFDWSKYEMDILL